MFFNFEPRPKHRWMNNLIVIELPFRLHLNRKSRDLIVETQVVTNDENHVNDKQNGTSMSSLRVRIDDTRKCFSDAQSRIRAPASVTHKTQNTELQRSKLHRFSVDKCVLFIFAQEIETQIMMIFVRCLSRRCVYVVNMWRRKHGKSTEAQTAQKWCELWQVEKK